MKKFNFFSAAFIILPVFSLVNFVYGQSAATVPNVKNPFSDFSVKSPLQEDINDVPDLVLTILTVLISIAVPIIVIAIVYAGFSYVTAQGNPEKIKTATRTLTYAIIGAVLCIGALVITDIIGETVQSFGSAT